MFDVKALEVSGTVCIRTAQGVGSKSTCTSITLLVGGSNLDDLQFQYTSNTIPVGLQSDAYYQKPSTNRNESN